MKSLATIKLVLIGFSLAIPSYGSWQTLWNYGSHNRSTDELGTPEYTNNAPPGSANKLDDDYYFAGTYASPIGTLSTAESLSFAESEIHTSSNTKRIHFNLSNSQLASTSLFRVSFRLMGGGHWDGSTVYEFSEHNFEVRVIKGNGASTASSDNTILATINDVNFEQVITITAPASAFAVGENTLQIRRTGGYYSNNSWVKLDFVTLEVDNTALQNGDNDGLPRWWEREYYLSDSNSGDAGLDPDKDGRTNLQEYNNGNNSTNPLKSDSDGDGLTDGQEATAGTNPNQTDTDKDGLTDFDETNGSPTSNPLQANSDSDAANDPLERAYGTSPTTTNSPPPVFADAIGLRFMVQPPDQIDSSLNNNEVAGVFPQRYWNETMRYYTWRANSGSTADVRRPVRGSLVNANGATVSGLTFNFTAYGANSTGRDFSSFQKLFDTYLTARKSSSASSTQAVSLTLNGIPYSNYDLIVYFNEHDTSRHGYVERNGVSGSARYFRSFTSPRQNTYMEARATAFTETRANYVRYRNLSGSSQSISLHAVSDGDYDSYVGLCAVQIVNTGTDTDGDNIPDAWEYSLKLNPNSNGDRNTDPDGDGRSNHQEYTSGTNPFAADTDGDGLNDNDEAIAGTDPNSADTDDDGLSDAEERIANGLSSNPLSKDSDGDGADDRRERDFGTNPLSDTVKPTSLVPVYVPNHTSGRDAWVWSLDNIQFIWDHGQASSLKNEYGNHRALIIFDALSAVPGSVPERFGSLDLALIVNNNKLSYYFHGDPQTNLGRANNSGGVESFYYGFRDTDLTSALGFSGYGSHDISDILKIEIICSRPVGGATNSWRLNLKITNKSTGGVAVDYTVPNGINNDYENGLLVASPSFHAGTTVWKNYAGEINVPWFRTLPGFRYVFNSTALETLPAFANFADNDEDGIPNVWESNYNFDINNSYDATTDADNDSIINREEYLLGTNPRSADTDGDGANDAYEIAQGSTPTNSASKPPLFGQNITSGNHDLNNNTLNDAWEAAFRFYNRPGSADDDGDGESNLLESISGGNPLDARDRLWINAVRNGNNLNLNWNNRLHKRHLVRSGTNLTNWTTQQTLTPTTSANQLSTTLSGFYSNAQTRNFARVQIEDLDSDSDGLNDWTENWLRTNPNNAQSSRQSVNTANGSVSGDYSLFVDTLKSVGGNAATEVTPSRIAAARFLDQATLGTTLEEIDRVTNLGYNAWIEDQKTKTPSYMLPTIDRIFADYFGPYVDHTYAVDESNDTVFGINFTIPWMRAAVTKPDLLRQRVAFALSQILVVSRRDTTIESMVQGMANYYDLFVKHALGNYRDLLLDVSQHPIMGRYLSHIGNQKANPAINQFPDENYAREIMQLFTIGLWELNTDGSRKLDANGQFIPTYSNTDITELSRVFTGQWLAGQPWLIGHQPHLYTMPMEIHPDRHDYGQKNLLRGQVIPARAPTVANAKLDIENAVDSLFNHPNTPVFISKQLIQFLVTYNPSPAYVQRIQSVFVNNGNGVRGDLAAVVKAILLDAEARDPGYSRGQDDYGRLREPVQRFVSLARAFKLDKNQNFAWWNWGDFSSATFQEPLLAPSVFNFYRPDYQAPGEVTQRNKVSPAFQITDSYSAISLPNEMWRTIDEGFRNGNGVIYPLDFQQEIEIADNVPALVDRLNLILCAGQMSAKTREIIIDKVDDISVSEPWARVRVGVYLTATSPDGAIQR